MLVPRIEFTICLLFLILFALGCRDFENPVRVKNIPDDDPTLPSLQLTGLWQGNINGENPYFRGNPVLTLELNQYEALVQGIIRTSDGAFKNDTLREGSAEDSLLIFYVRETNYYTGEILAFSANYNNDTLSGYWYSSNRDSSYWYAVRQK